jgi:N-acetylglucosaminyl-diphospho-decaprenol L-rhamnosyltransferase
MDSYQRQVNDTNTQPIVLSIIIATYNARQLLAECLRSIETNPLSEPNEIIVVDDASADGTSEMVRSEFPYVRLLRNAVNRKYGYSTNRALDEARGDYILLLNNDTVVLPDALDRMLAFLRDHPAGGAVGCRLLNGDGSIQWSVKSLPNAWSAWFGARSLITRLYPNNRFSRQHLLHLSHDMTTPFVAGYVSSAAVMIPRHVVAAVGYFDKRLMYHVDADYCKRIADAGYASWYLPTASIIHFAHQGGTMVSLRRRFRSVVEFHIGSYIYYCKHVARSRWSVRRIFVAAALAARFVVALCGQICAELVGALRSLARPKRAVR